MSKRYFERIGFTGDGAQLITEIGDEFNLGQVQTSAVLTVGFEDCNVKVEAGSGSYVIKAFGTWRSESDINRYIEVIQAAVDGGVSHPALHQTKACEALLRRQDGISAIVMDFIEGQTYFDAKNVPTDGELALIAKEAQKIHQLGINPPFVPDTWAIPNINKMYGITRQFLDDDGHRLTQAALERYGAINKDRLEKCFVHGDIISTNTLKDGDGKIWILDFSVSNVYPKIQELAVSTSLLADDKKFIPLEERVERVREAYLSVWGTLTDYDHSVLTDYSIAGAAMEFMGGHKAKYIDKEDPLESDHWVKIGKETLQEALK